MSGCSTAGQSWGTHSTFGKKEPFPLVSTSQMRLAWVTENRLTEPPGWSGCPVSLRVPRSV